MDRRDLIGFLSVIVLILIGGWIPYGAITAGLLGGYLYRGGYQRKILYTSYTSLLAYLIVIILLINAGYLSLVLSKSSLFILYIQWLISIASSIIICIADYFLVFPGFK